MEIIKNRSNMIGISKFIRIFAGVKADCHYR